MLDMVSEVEVEKIPYSEIVISLLSLHDLIVFSDGVDGGWMGTDRYKGDQNQIS